MHNTYVYIGAPRGVPTVRFKTLRNQKFDDTISQWEDEVRQGDADLYRIDAEGNVHRYRRGDYDWHTVDIG